MNKEIFEILQTVPVGAMATVNRDRTPLVSPLHFAVLGDATVWMSSRASRHAQNAVRSGRVDFVVWNDKKQGVFLHTTAPFCRRSAWKRPTRHLPGNMVIFGQNLTISRCISHRLAHLMKILQHKICGILLPNTLHIAYYEA